jgi:hypothetical protein
MQEERREPWATLRVRALKLALRQDNMEPLVRSLECRATLCRIELSAADNNALVVALRHNIHLGKETGFDTVGGFEGDGAERRLVMFTARPGTRL